MQLAKKKALAAKVLGIGKERVVFVKGNMAEIKEAITRQDILDLHKSGAIKVKEISGRKVIVKRKHRRGVGKVKKRVNKKKQVYVKLTRKLRTNLRSLLKIDKITTDQYRTARKMIRASKFKSKRHMNESLGEI